MIVLSISKYMWHNDHTMDLKGILGSTLNLDLWCDWLKWWSYVGLCLEEWDYLDYDKTLVGISCVVLSPEPLEMDQVTYSR